jgi:NAD(P)-dependent dehydrogenase (short-subunit alcohol dehydrogenase family)
MATEAVTRRVVLVTGASAGIGRAVADRLAASGWTVVGTSRRGTGSSSGAWAGAVMDVDDDASVSEGTAAVLGEHGRLDAVVAAAGWGLAGPVETTPLADARAQVETNFWGAVRVVQAALPTMRTRGSGRLVLVSSIGGVVALPFQAFYSASKFAMEGYGEALAYEVAPYGVHVTMVEPGNVRTDFTASRRDVGGGADDPYAGAMCKAIDTMAEDERNGVDPDRVATVVERVLTARRPPRRASVGRMDERVGIVGKRLLPFALFERAAKGSLGL